MRPLLRDRPHHQAYLDQAAGDGAIYSPAQLQAAQDRAGRETPRPDTRPAPSHQDVPLAASERECQGENLKLTDISPKRAKFRPAKSKCPWWQLDRFSTLREMGIPVLSVDMERKENSFL